MTLDESATVKGTPVRSLQKFVEADLRPDQRETAFRNMPPEYAARFRSVILPTETIPVHMLNRFTTEAAKAKGESVESFGRRAGQSAANDAVKGIYRFFALVLTPAALLSRVSQMWSSLYNRGEVRVEDQTSNSARLVLVNFPSEPAGCARITGWIDQMALLTGVKLTRIEHPRCLARGDKACEWKMEWT